MHSSYERVSNPPRTIDAIRIPLLAALFAALTAVGALLRIPVPPVPFTLQTLFVFLAAGLLGPTGGFLSQCLYLAVGLLGIPVFSSGGGIGYIFNPTFGYLLGFPVAALVMGILSRRFVHQKEHNKNRKSLIVKFILIYSIGAVIIYIFGISFLFFYAENILGEALSILWVGFIIFIPTDIVKIAVGAWLTVRLRRLGIVSSIC